MLSWESIFSFNCQINLFATFNSATAESPLTKSNAINFALEYEKQILFVSFCEKLVKLRRRRTINIFNFAFIIYI